MASVTLHEGDNRVSLRRLIDAGVRVHSVVCDPPYGLTSITKRFGKDGAAPAKSLGATGVFGRSSKGFHGQLWDGSGIERDPEFWRLIWEILLPGGYVIAFSGSRTGHWQACAMEMAGFVMHPMIGWVSGQGFPKAHNASKAIDRELGADRPVIGVADVGPDMTGDNYGRNDGQRRIAEITTSGSAAAAAAWEGWAYGTQSMKPALEPIYVGQKPFSERNGALNLLRHGVGALNIDGCRVPTGIGDRESYGVSGDEGSPSANAHCYGERGRVAYERSALGRHPANLIHDGSDDVVALFPNSSVTGKRTAASKVKPVKGTNWLPENHESTEYTDSGSAARFFNSFQFACDQCGDTGLVNGYTEGMVSHQEGCPQCGDIPPVDPDPIHYHPKAGKADRAGSKHPTVKPIALMQWLVRLVTPPGGMVLDPFAGSGTTGQAATNEGFDCLLMEAEAAYIADIKRRFGLETYDLDDILGLTPESVDDLIG